MKISFNGAGVCFTVEWVLERLKKVQEGGTRAASRGLGNSNLFWMDSLMTIAKAALIESLRSGDFNAPMKAVIQDFPGRERT